MPWARLDDGLLGHHKFEGIDDDLLGFWTRGLIHAVRNLTNGRIPARLPKTQQQRRRAEVIVRAGLWHRAKGLQGTCKTCWEMVQGEPGDGWVIHEYLEYNPSKESVQRTRRMNRERQTRFREAREATVTPLVTPNEGVTNGQDDTRNGPPYLTVPVLAAAPKKERNYSSAHAPLNGNDLTPERRALIQARLREIQQAPRAHRDRLTMTALSELVRHLGWSEDQVRSALLAVGEEMQ